MNIGYIILTLITFSFSSLIKKDNLIKGINVGDLINYYNNRICYTFIQGNSYHKDCFEREHLMNERIVYKNSDFDIIFEKVKIDFSKQIKSIDLKIFESVLLVNNLRIDINSLYYDVEKFNNFLKKLISKSLKRSSVNYDIIFISFKNSLIK